MITRAQYMSDSSAEYLANAGSKSGASNAHRAYFGQFVTDTVRSMVARTFGVETLRVSLGNDEHLNNITLRRWDALGAILPSDIIRMINAAGTGGVSLSDRVCVLKEAARQIVEGVQ